MQGQQQGRPVNPHGKANQKMTELERFLSSNQDLIMEAAHKVQQKVVAENEKCVGITNEDKFVACLQKVDAKLTPLHSKFEYRLQFWKLQTEQCFAENPKDLDKCKATSRANVRKYLDSFVRQL